MKKIKRFIQHHKNGAGFTMIELLIVIAVLGILAVAVLSAINPIEQINRGRDTGKRSDGEQLLSACERYDAAHGYFPWQTGPGEDLVAGTPDVPFTATNVSPITTYIQTLVDFAEIKTGFQNRIIDVNDKVPLHIYYNDEVTGASIYVCFQAQSQAFEKEANDSCTNLPATPPADRPTEACPATCANSTTDANHCLICLP